MKRIKNSIIKCLVLMLFFANISFQANCQQANTSYFIENSPLRHTLNPAFRPKSDYYLSLPIIGSTYIGLGNNSISLHDVIYNYNGNTVSFLDSEGGNLSKFYNSLQKTTVARADAQINLVSFGFKNKDSFWSFTVTQVIDTMVGIPKDLFKLLLFGTPEIDANTYNLKKLQSDATAYTEAAIGYSIPLGKKWMVGAKLKLLYGSANFSTKNKSFKLETGLDKLILNGSGSVNYSSPMQLQLPNDIYSILFSKPSTLIDWVRKPSGLGAGVDLGVDYKLNNEIRLSASLTDVGFINWYNNPQNVNYGVDYFYDGIANINNSGQLGSFLTTYNQQTTPNQIVDSLYTALLNAGSVSNSNNSYTTGTTAKLNIAAEYNLLENKMSIGLLSRSYFFKNTMTEEITFSVNAKPNEKINTSVSYSIFNGGLNSMGIGIGWKTGILHWLLAADYIPFEKTNLSLKELNLTNNEILIPIPYKTKSFNFSIGVNFVFDKDVRRAGIHKYKAGKTCNCN